MDELKIPKRWVETYRQCQMADSYALVYTYGSAVEVLKSIIEEISRLTEERDQWEQNCIGEEHRANRLTAENVALKAQVEVLNAPL